MAVGEDGVDEGAVSEEVGEGIACCFETIAALLLAQLASEQVFACFRS